jgi:RNA polymerase sigma-70 factor (sigma-E family)
VDYASARLPVLHRAACALIGGDAHRADDLVQGTMTNLYRYWPRVRAVENVDAYVRRMLTRQFLDEKRLPWSRVLLGSLRPDPPARRDGLGFEEREAVHAALRRLPPGQRAVLVLRYLYDMSVEDTAAALRCSVGNVKSQSSRGIETLRGLLGSAANGRRT